MGRKWGLSWASKVSAPGAFGDARGQVGLSQYGGAAGGIYWVGVRAATGPGELSHPGIHSAPVENRCQVRQPGRGQRGPQLRGETVPSALREGRPSILPRVP